MGSAAGAAVTAWLEAQEGPCTGLETMLRAAPSPGTLGRKAGMSHCLVLVGPSSGTPKADAEPAQMWQPDGQLLKIPTGSTLLLFVCWPLGQSFEM